MVPTIALMTETFQLRLQTRGLDFGSEYLSVWLAGVHYEEVKMFGDDSTACCHMHLEEFQVQCCFTCAEAVRTIRDMEPATVIATFPNLLSSALKKKNTRGVIEHVRDQRECHIECMAGLVRIMAIT